MGRKNKGNSGEEPVNTLAWMMTFSDLVMLLLTFFVLLLTMSSMDKKKLKDLFTNFSGSTGVLEFAGYGKIKDLATFMHEYHTTDGMLVIIDDPTEGLDAEGSRMVAEALNGLSKRGRTVIVFSHDAHILSSAPYYMDLNSKPMPKMVKKDADKHAPAPLAAVPASGKKPTAASAKKATS